MKKVNITIGRFQPFTKGHLNMVTEGDLPCIVYRINSSKNDEDFTKIKVKGKVVKKADIQSVLAYLDNNGEGNLTDTQKEILKRPFTNDLIEKELEIVKRSNKKYFEDVIYVTNAYEAIADFASKVAEGLYEPNYLMCGDDRVDTYSKMINSDKPWKTPDGKEVENVLKGKLEVNIGKGRTEGVSGTAVRASIIKNDKSAFAKIMPAGADAMFDDFVAAFKSFKETLANTVNEYHNFVQLADFITESIDVNTYITEGGAAGHMSHPFDYDEFTGHDLLELVDDLFGGKIENMKEKLDGTNIHATMNNNGQVVFIRNKSNLNSELGGMSIQDMADKWADKPGVQKTFLTAGKIITEIFNKLGVKYFNPDSETRKVINCECIIAGKTNIMPYAEDRVAFHGYVIYKKNGSAWEEVENVEGHVDDIYKAAAGIDSARPRMNLVIKSVEEAAKFAKVFKSDLENLFKAEGLSLKNTIEDWKRARFNKLKPEWLDKEVDRIYDRWFNNDKSFKASELKKIYTDHYDDVKSDKFAKTYVKSVMEPIDDLFLEIGNAFIKMCDGFTNASSHNTIVDTLKKDLSDVCAAVEKSGSDEVKQQLEFQLNRLRKLGDNAINSAEGVVFVYKGRLMKCTGSFAALNQALGLRFNINEGILNDIENTLANSDKDVKAVLYKQLINGITSYDGKEQKNAVELFKQTLKDLKVKPTTNHMDMYKSKSWWVQFKEHSTGYEFIMIKQYSTSEKRYIIYIDKYGTATKYWCTNNFNGAISYLIPGKPIYEVPESMNPICEETFRIMYMR
jgi:hypothetical protein